MEIGQYLQPVGVGALLDQVDAQLGAAHRPSLSAVSVGPRESRGGSGVR
jgi:hypothetical protein